MASGSSLRARQRDQTRRLLHDAVIELSAREGFAHVTVDAISARAGVSPRTFFNYFPSKEAAVVLDPPVQLRGEPAERFAAGPISSPRQLLVELIGLLLEQLENDPPERGDAEGLFAIAADNPGVFSAMVAQLDAVRMDLSATIATRLAAGGDRQVANLIAALAMAAVRSGLEEWAARGQDPHDDSPVPFVRRAVEIVTSLAADPSD